MDVSAKIFKTPNFFLNDEKTNKSSTLLTINGPLDVAHYSKNKEVILVIDVSASMRSSISTLKRALKLFGDLLHDIDISIITFSDEAKLIYQSNQKKNNDSLYHYDGYENSSPYNLVIDTITVEGNTNISSALNMAFSITNCDKMSSIVVFSDGMPNKDITSIGGFKNLASIKPPKVRIICAGFGSESSSEILSAIGEFKYIAMKSQNEIATFFAGVVFEITTSIAADLKYDSPDSIYLPDVIYVGSKFQCIVDNNTLTSSSNANVSQDSFIIIETTLSQSESESAPSKRKNLEPLIIGYTDLVATTEKVITVLPVQSDIDRCIISALLKKKIDNIIMNIRDIKEKYTNEEFTQYRDTAMKEICNFDHPFIANDKGSFVIMLQAAFDALDNRHVFEDMLTQRRTQTSVDFASPFLNRRKSEFVTQVCEVKYSNDIDNCDACNAEMMPAIQLERQSSILDYTGFDLCQNLTFDF